MLIKIISITISYSLLFFVNHNFKSAYTTDFEAHYRGREIIDQKKCSKKNAMKKLEKFEELIQKKRNFKNHNRKKISI